MAGTGDPHDKKDKANRGHPHGETEMAIRDNPHGETDMAIRDNPHGEPGMAIGGDHSGETGMADMGNSRNQVLVLGATGGIGGETARKLRDAGWRVLALHRRLSDDVVRRDGITWLRGDAMNRDDVLRAAHGCSVIVHGVNPPGYRRWGELVLPMIDNTIAAASAERAVIVLPGTVYNYGPDAFPLLHEAAPQRPLTRKGAIRVELERRLQAAAISGAICRIWRRR